MFVRLFVWTAALGVIGASARSEEASAPSLAAELARVPQKTPQEEAKTFQVAHGFRMELAAAEPVVTDPVAGAFDENGRLYVVEMRDYPFERQPRKEPLGQVRRLEDQDEDGIFEKWTLFADKLEWPTSVAVWDGGVFVTAAPDLWYLKDTDGDGRADVRRRVLTGFGKSNVQGLFNGLIWGIDHKLYGAGSVNGGQIRNLDRGSGPIPLQGADFTFEPKCSRFEPLPGSAQNGHSFDDAYRRFLCSNSDHAQMVVLPGHYLARNPYLPATGTVQSIAKEGGAAPVFRISKPEPWRVVRTRRRAASGVYYPPTELVVTGYFTSASGITVYRGDAYPPEFRGNLFVGDVGGNLIHRKTLSENGVLLSATRADPGREFIASTDNWFRPVNFLNGPDGTLLVFDMYRETIEHPWSIPDDIKAHLDLESGRDQGRIWRIVPPGFRRRAIPKLGELSAAELVPYLEHPNCWHRETAHRLLWERQDVSIAPAVRRLLQKSPNLLGRLHALWTLDGLREAETTSGSATYLSAADLLLGLSDGDPIVREHAIRLTEGRTLDPSVRRKLSEMVDDAEPRVRFQLALCLGNYAGAAPELREMAALARKSRGDFWQDTAVLCSNGLLARGLLMWFLTQASSTGDVPSQRVIQLLGATLGAEWNNITVHIAGRAALDPRVPVEMAQSALIGLADGSRRHRPPKEIREALDAASLRRLEAMTAHAIELAKKDDDATSDRMRAIQFLSIHPSHAVIETCAGLLTHRQPVEVRRAALSVLTLQNGADIGVQLAAAWPSTSADLRSEIIEALLGRPLWNGILLEAIVGKTIPLESLTEAQCRRLMAQADPAKRDQARKLCESRHLSPRAAVISQYQAALTAKPDLARGARVYERECQSCHRLAGRGHDVGPNFATIKNRSPADLLLHILDPNREVLPKYMDYVAALADGRVVSGLIAAESAGSITFGRAEGISETILRSEIDSLSSTGKSIMPEGFERKITPSEMNDLLAYLLKTE